MNTILKAALSLTLALFIAGCSTKTIEVDKVKSDEFGKYAKFGDISQGNMLEVSWEDLEGFEDDDMQKAFHTFKVGCEKSARYELLKHSCEASKLYTTKPKEFFVNNFVPYQLYDHEHSDTGIITGYYEPLLNGSRKKTSKYKYPIYQTPKDMIEVDLTSIYPELKNYRLRGKIKGNKLIPYDKRGEIKEDKNKEVIVYVDDKVDVYFLHIQGSGRVKLDTNEIINVGYANQNGHKYRSTGRYMIDRGLLKNYGGSMQGMRAWFKDNPSKADSILNLNESYVFFQESSQTATGALGVPLIAKRNLAVDRRYIPLGLPVFINTQTPVTKEPIAKIMVAADVGGAIKGEIRADFYWGYGDSAGEIAGKMKENGKLFVFLPKDYIDKKEKDAYNK